MKKILTFIALIVMLSPAFADDAAHLKISIRDAVQSNRYYLCLYGIGCLSIKNGSNGKVFPIMPIDMGNIEKMVITDTNNMQMYTQDSVKSCDVKVNTGDKMTISGDLVVTGNGPVIKGLRCSVVKA